MREAERVSFFHDLFFPYHHNIQRQSKPGNIGSLNEQKLLLTKGTCSRTGGLFIKRVIAYLLTLRIYSPIDTNIITIQISELTILISTKRTYHTASSPFQFNSFNDTVIIQIRL